MISQNEIIQWLQEYKETLSGCPLEKEKIPEFVKELQDKIGQMDWSQVEGKTIVAYSGSMGVTNEKGKPVWAWNVVEEIIPTEPELAAKSQGTFLRVTEPGILYNDEEIFQPLLKKILGEEYVKVFDGRDPSTGERLPAGYSEYNGEKVQSLADYFSAQLMKQAKNTTGNIVVLIPEKVDETKVFATTEIFEIFENDDFKTMNGISKDLLKDIYYTGEDGVQAVYRIMESSSKMAVGNATTVEGMAEAVTKAFTGNGILTEAGNPFTITCCYDQSGSFIGVQLDAKGQGTLVKAPENTVHRSSFAATTYEEARTKKLFGEKSYNAMTDGEKATAREATRELHSYANGESTTSDTGKTTNTGAEKTTSTEKTTDTEKTTSTEKTADTDKTTSNEKTSGTQEKSGDSTDNKKSAEGQSKEANQSKENKNGLDKEQSNTSIKDETKKVGSTENTTQKKDYRRKYMETTGKTEADLTDTDKAILRYGQDLIDDPDVAKAFEKTISKYKGLIKAGEKAGTAFDVLDASVTMMKGLKNASEAHENGDDAKATAYICGATAEAALTQGLGITFTEALLPYFTAFGSMFGGLFETLVATLGAALVGGGLASMMAKMANEMVLKLVDLDEFLDASTIFRSADPVVLDLNRDGLFTKSKDDGAYFDYQSDGLAEKTGWIHEEDGLLIRDINKNGIVDGGSELFGNLMTDDNGAYYKDGFAALADFDSNKDGVIDSKDDGWEELKVWQDKNADGSSTEDELFSMSDLGIQELNVSEGGNGYVENGNRISKLGSYETVDGESYGMADIDFHVDSMDTLLINPGEISKEIEALPDIQGSGRVRSLHQAMKEDNELKNLVEKFVNTKDHTERIHLVDEIVKVWADCGEIKSGSRGNYVDAEHLEIIEKFSGERYVIKYVIVGSQSKDGEKRYNIQPDWEHARRSSPDSSSGVKLEYIYAKLLENVYTQLVVQTDLIFPLTFTFVNEETGEIDYNFAKVYFTELLKEDTLGTMQLIREFTMCMQVSPTHSKYFDLEEFKNIFADYGVLQTAIAQYNNQGFFYGTDDEDRLSGNQNGETYLAGIGDDIVYGNNGNDVLYGENGNDTLYGGNGEDILVGGEGNDYLYGDNGNDTYVFNIGDGEDVIRDSGKVEEVDTIVFGEGIKAEDITIQRENNNLVIKYGENDKVTVQNAYSYNDGRGFVERIEFSDGTKLEAEDINRIAGNQQGTGQDDTMYGYGNSSGYSQNESFYAGAGNDRVYGNDGDDTLYGETGNDTLQGGTGDDILVGGTGNDYLDGGYGKDTYIFHIGDGEDTIRDNGKVEEIDTIVFGEGIKAEDITIQRENNNLVIKYGENDKLTVQNAYNNGDGRWFVERIEFADGTKLEAEDMNRIAGNHQGTDKDDIMCGYGNSSGYSQNESFYAGAGNDKVNGNEGDDILVGETGNDYLYGGYGNDIYVFNIGDGEDIIQDNGKVGEIDTIAFGEGIKAEDITIQRENNNLVIKYGENDKVTVQNAYSYGDGKWFVERIEFADGTKLEAEDINRIAGNHQGTDKDDIMSGYRNSSGYSQNESFYAGAGNDSVNGNDGDDTLYGETGNDTLRGGNGDDILIGGEGNDYLYGDYGRDTYVFNIGDGKDSIWDYGNTEEKDTIVFGEGIKAEDIKIERESNHLVIKYGENDKVTVQNAYSYGDGKWFVERIEFADGTKLEAEDINRIAGNHQGTDKDDTMYGYGNSSGYGQNESFYAGAGNDSVNGCDGDDTLYGETGNDTLRGGNGDDILVGGEGNDYLYGDYGSDTYIFEPGDGNDILSDYGNLDEEDTIKINVDAKNIMMQRLGVDLQISLAGEEDTITVKNWYNNDRYKVENIQSADGYSLSSKQVDLLIQSMASFESTSGMSWTEGLYQNNNEIEQITSQIWIKQER